MRVIRTERDDIGYSWVCPNCFYGTSIVESTPLHGIKIRSFDMVIKLFERGFHPMGATKMLGGDSTVRTIYF